MLLFSDISLKKIRNLIYKKVWGVQSLEIYSMAFSDNSVCEFDLQDFSKQNKLKSLAICDTSNLCGALEFAEKISKVGTQPIIGTQINFKYNDVIGLIPLFALNEEGYKRIIKLSSNSFLENDALSEPHVDFNELLEDNEGVSIFSGTIFGFFGELFNKGKLHKSRYGTLDPPAKF